MSDAQSNHRTDLWTAVCAWMIFLIPLFSFPLIWTHPRWFLRYPYHFEFPWSGLAVFVVLAALAVAVLKNCRPTLCVGASDQNTDQSVTERAAADTQCRPTSILVGTRPLLLMMALVAGSCFLSIVTSSHQANSASLLPSQLGFLALFWIGSQVPSLSLPQICRTWFWTAMVLVVFGLARLITVPDFGATFGNRNFLAAFLVSGLLMGIAHTLVLLSHGKRKRVIPAGLGCLLILAGVRLCGSRGAYLALVAVSAAWFIWWAPLWRTKALLKLCLVAAVGLIGLVMVKPYLVKVWAEDVRPPIWEGTINMILARPVFGHGLGRYDAVLYDYLPAGHYERPKAAESVFHAHNEPLEIAAEQGFIGLLVMAGLWVFCFGRNWPRRGTKSHKNLSFVQAFSNCRAPNAFGADCLTSTDSAKWTSVRDGNTKDSTDPPSTNSWFSGATRCVPPCEERLYRLAIAGSVLAYLVHNLVDVNSRVPPMQAFGWLMLGLMASAGEQAETSKLSWRIEPAKRTVMAGLLVLLIVVAAWSSVVRPIRAEVHEQVARIALADGALPKAAMHAAESLDANPYQLETRYMYAGIFDRWAHEDPARADEFRTMAIEQCEALRMVAPDYDTVAIRLAYLYAQDGQKEKARGLAEWVLARRPKEKEAVRLIGLMEQENQRLIK